MPTFNTRDLWPLPALVACCLALSGCGATGLAGNRKAAARPAAPAAETAILLRPYFRQLKSVEVKIAGEPHSFLFDTGGGLTVITPKLAEKLGCSPFGRIVGHRMKGDAVEFTKCERLEAQAGAARIVHAPVAVFDLGKLIPPQLPPLDGVLSLDSFRGQVLTIDWDAGKLTLHSPAGARAALAASGVPARAATGDSGGGLTVLLPVEGARGDLWFLLDSGNISGTLIAEHLAREKLVSLSPEGSARLRVGPRPAEDMPVNVEPINYDGVLGAHYLLSRPITLDLRNVPQPAPAD